MIKFVYGPGGTLSCRQHLPGITQELVTGTFDDDDVEPYVGKHFICETISISAARKFAELLGGELVEIGGDES